MAIEDAFVLGRELRGVGHDREQVLLTRTLILTLPLTLTLNPNLRPNDRADVPLTLTRARTLTPTLTPTLILTLTLAPTLTPFLNLTTACRCPSRSSGTTRTACCAPPPCRACRASPRPSSSSTITRSRWSSFGHPS